ncbi:hypothetical protein P171DRAFT_524102 [Karstenula rhodostoma CBS 690.94]|uniref:Uncharacterized protein n=1 Tax=Karstenula rhodostoma CBS 690.94 TaxID=1392251 RepID=A0A9P4PBR9_9PLEO|nr:hypothetical protein P171DRAFT_524102 [Karstenula rhodostoma CBS 690.94]
MAPPHTSKQTSSTTSQATSRRGVRQVKKLRVDNYEEEVIDDHNDADLDMDNAEAEELTGDLPTDASQDASQPNAVQQLLRDMQADQLKRNELRKKAVYKAYNTAHASTQEAITSHFDEHEAKAVEAYEAQMARLKDLLEMKAEIERAMAQKLGELRKDYVYHSKAVEMVVQHRMNQLK